MKKLLGSIESVLTFFLVFILILLLLIWLGPPLERMLPEASQNLSDILHRAWEGINNIGRR
jgi:F0F1-type ATP synthase membrane subunit b/b'